MTCPKGKGGRPPKTNNEKMILGVKKDRINFNEPDLVTVAPTVPEWEKGGGELDAVGLQIFQYYAKMLFANGTVGQTDETALYQLAYTAREWLRAKAQCDKYGRNHILKDKSGNVRETRITAWSRMERELHRDYVKLLREFGCTPLARGAIQKIGNGEEALDIPQIT